MTTPIDRRGQFALAYAYAINAIIYPYIPAVIETTIFTSAMKGLAYTFSERKRPYFTFEAEAMTGMFHGLLTRTFWIVQESNYPSIYGKMGVGALSNTLGWLFAGPGPDYDIPIHFADLARLAMLGSLIGYSTLKMTEMVGDSVCDDPIKYSTLVTGSSMVIGGLASTAFKAMTNFAESKPITDKMGTAFREGVTTGGVFAISPFWERICCANI